MKNFTMPKVNQHDRNMDRKRVGLSKVGFGLEEDMSQVDLVMALADAFAEAETSFWMGQENPNYEVFTSARISRNEARDALLAAVTAHADEVESLRADAATAIAIQRAAKELPEFYNISIEIERGYGGVRLSNPNNEITAFEFDEGDAGLADCINEAVNAARAAQGE